MDPFWKKLNYKGHHPVTVENAPESFAPLMKRLPAPAEPPTGIPFSLSFCITQDELNQAADRAVQLPEGDPLVWVAYPKKSSKKYTCEFDRDHGWEAWGKAGFEPVRMVAIDGDWSALRMRRVAYIKTLKRRNSMALSAQGKRRTADNKR